MAFCSFASETIISNSTLVDNIFINDFLPDAQGDDVRIYLYGLYNCNNKNFNDNTFEKFCTILNLDGARVKEAFDYWEKRGLVKIIATEPFEVVYLPMKDVVNNVRKYAPGKYDYFNKELDRVYKGHKTITLQQYREYYDFMEYYRMEQEALIHILEYCISIKDIDISHRYVLTVAKAWAGEGILTYEKVEQKLLELEQSSSEIGEIFKILGLKRTAGVDEKEYLSKWENEYGFTFDTIIGVLKLNKKRKKVTTSFEKLDTIFKNYLENKMFDIKEIENMEQTKETLNRISRQVCKNLGIYYENVEPVSQNYTYSWVNKGYDEDTLCNIANYCFKSNIKTLSGMDTIINKFYKLGIITKQALDEYLANILRNDEEIKEVLDELGIVRNVNKYDRDFYNTWINDWQLGKELIFGAVTFSKDKVNPMQYLNKILSIWHTNGVKNVKEGEKFIPNENSYASKNMENKSKQNYKEQRTYSSANIAALFDNLEEVEL